MNDCGAIAACEVDVGNAVAMYSLSGLRGMSSPAWIRTATTAFSAADRRHYAARATLGYYWGWRNRELLSLKMKQVEPRIRYRLSGSACGLVFAQDFKSCGPAYGGPVGSTPTHFRQ